MTEEFCFHTSTKAQFWIILKDLLATGKRYRVTIREWRERRTLDQNGLMWKWNTEISVQVNKYSSEKLTKDDLHEFFKDLFCPEKEISVLGIKRRVKSTKLLDTGEMHFYLNRIEQWAHEKGLKLTIPNECEYNELKLRQVA